LGGWLGGMQYTDCQQEIQQDNVACGFHRIS
jgi:hypothetical protein